MKTLQIGLFLSFLSHVAAAQAPAMRSFFSPEKELSGSVTGYGAVTTKLPGLPVKLRC
jgi:hypothetical protein